MKGLIGRKVGMTQLFNAAGDVVPVTVIEAGPCPVVQVKTPARDGYAALQLGFGVRKARRTSRALQGHFARAGVAPQRRLTEVRFPGAEEVAPGTLIRADLFRVGEHVDVSGVSRGKGFQGGMRRWGFDGTPDSHGAKAHREPGSIGQCATPGRVWKGHHMAGHTGARRVTMRNLEVIQVDAERNVLVLRGAVPGARNGLVLVRKREM
jgi:large subunit ribosomal protein L3